MLNCLWIVTVSAKRMLINALFHFYRERFTLFLPRDHTSEIRFCGITSEYRISTKSLVTVTFLPFQRIESSKATGVPSPTISMAQRTALRLLVNSLLKQVTFIRLCFRQNSGLFRFGLDRSLRDQARCYFTWATSYSGQSTTGLHKTSVFWQ